MINKLDFKGLIAVGQNILLLLSKPKHYVKAPAQYHYCTEFN